MPRGVTSLPWQCQWENAWNVGVLETTPLQLGAPRSQHRSAWRLAAGSSAALLILSLAAAPFVLSAGSGGPSCALGSCRSHSYSLDTTLHLKVQTRKNVSTHDYRRGCLRNGSVSEQTQESLRLQLAKHTSGQHIQKDSAEPCEIITNIARIPSRNQCSAMQNGLPMGVEAKIGLCRGFDEFFSPANLTADVDFPVVDPSTNIVQLGRLRDHLDAQQPLQRRRWKAAFEALQALSEFQARDIFAFRETWTDIDTELLRGLDAETNGFVPDDNFTTEGFAARLPGMEELKIILDAGQSLAIVGGSGSLTGRGLGQEIDAHDKVVRFNGIVGSKLLPKETGNVTTVRVMNTLNAPLEDPAILEIDLETLAPWSSYCKRMHSNGIFANNISRTLMIRPSAYCAMAASRAQEWTRGFLFYLFVGRLFNGSVDLYGFSGHDHYHNKKIITEKWVSFEHLFYKVNKLTCH